MDAAASERTSIEPHHRCGYATFVKEYQMFRRDRTDLGKELFAALEVSFCVAFGGVERLFLRRRPNFRTRYQTRPRLIDTPASLFSLACNWARVRSGCAETHAITCCCASTPACGLRPGWGGTRSA
jgi:hypothetical protein